MGTMPGGPYPYGLIWVQLFRHFVQKPCARCLCGNWTEIVQLNRWEHGREACMGPVWAHMDPYGPIWSIWSHMGFIWSPYGSRWTHMGLYGPIWAQFAYKFRTEEGLGPGLAQDFGRKLDGKRMGSHVWEACLGEVTLPDYSLQLIIKSGRTKS